MNFYQEIITTIAVEIQTDSKVHKYSEHNTMASISLWQSCIEGFWIYFSFQMVWNVVTLKQDTKCKLQCQTFWLLFIVWAIKVNAYMRLLRMYSSCDSFFFFKNLLWSKFLEIAKLFSIIRMLTPFVCCTNSRYWLWQTKRASVIRTIIK